MEAKKDEISNEVKTVMAFGTFDILHPGHIYFLKQAKKYGNLIIVIARDKTVKKIKGKLPRYSEKQRLEALKGLNLVDKAVLGYLGDKCKIINKFQPNIIALGYDQTHFTERLKKEFKKIKIIRLKAFKPEIYKSSKL